MYWFPFQCRCKFRIKLACFVFLEKLDIEKKTRNKQLVRLPLCRTNWGQQTSHYMFFNEWNNLPPFVKDSSSFLALKTNMSQYM